MRLSDLTDHTADFFRNAKTLAGQLRNPALRLGVTGLSRAGKTVFITSLVHNLINGGRLLFFDAAASGRLKAAYLEPQPDDTLPRFEFEDHLAALTGQPPYSAPTWPQGTRHISQLRLTLEYEPDDLLNRTFGSNRLHVDIVDYPGEWLLDLPLLSQSYDDWSRQTWQMSLEPNRAVLSKDWRQFTKSIDPTAAQDEAIARQAADLFKAYLTACRQDSFALSTIPPGRFLMPGDLEGSPALTFAPLHLPGSGSAPRGSLWAMMARRFESYKTHVVKPFFRDHFMRLDRQVILVDALGALNAGPEAVQDLQRAMSGILACFRPGKQTWLSALFQPRIDKMAFVATKADRLHHTSHERLEAILAKLTERAIEHAQYRGAEVEKFAIAALRTTTEVETRQDGEVWHCIQGLPEPGERLGDQVFDGKSEVVIFPGDLPANPDYALRQGCAGCDDEARKISRLGLNFIRFQPPRPHFNQATGIAVLPHIRLDRVLHFLLGDKLP